MLQAVSPAPRQCRHTGGPQNTCIKKSFVPPTPLAFTSILISSFTSSTTCKMTCVSGRRLKMRYQLVLYVTFNFDIIAASHLAVRNRTERSCEPLTLSPVGTSGKAVGQSHHPGDDEVVMQNSSSAWLDFAQGGIVVRVQNLTTVSL